MFRNQDIGCMRAAGVLLGDRRYMSDPSGNHANAVQVRDFLTGALTPRMPKGGPFWTQAMIDLYNQWMADGFLP
jgi:hypothetical protein